MVNALPIDFLQPAVPRGRLVGWGLLVIATALSSMAALHHDAAVRGHAVAAGRASQAEKRLRTALPELSPRAIDPATATALRRADAIIGELSVPWEELFDALEAADPKQLGLLVVSPVRRERSLRVTGEARTVTEVLAYVDRMAAQPSLHQVHLLNYQSVVRDGVPVVSFTLAAAWRL